MTKKNLTKQLDVIYTKKEMVSFYMRNLIFILYPGLILSPSHLFKIYKIIFNLFNRKSIIKQDSKGKVGLDSIPLIIEWAHSRSAIKEIGGAK